MTTSVDPRKLTQLLKNLVKIDSVNPSLVPGAAGEAEISYFIEGWMDALGLETELVEVESGRPNVIGTLRGSGGGKSLMLNGHTDTVGADYMTIDPFDPVIKESKLYGRGSVDMKGGLASSMAAVKAIVDSGEQLKGDVVIAGVCDEEFASIGTEHLMKNTIVDAAIIGEPTEFNVQVAHKGFAWIDVTTHGFATHGSAYKLGVDAIVKMGHILIGIEGIQKLLENTEHPLVGSGSIHASIISGGVELSTYPDTCKLEVERRLIPGESKQDVEDELQYLIKTLKDGDPKFNADYEITFFREPMEISSEEEICQLLRHGSKEVVGKEPEWVGGSGWMDTQIIHSKGIPAVAFGPSGYGLHAAEEWVDLESVYDAAKVQELVIRLFCT